MSSRRDDASVRIVYSYSILRLNILDHLNLVRLDQEVRQRLTYQIWPASVSVGSVAL
jgi:hypothetical protein